MVKPRNAIKKSAVIEIFFIVAKKQFFELLKSKINNFKILFRTNINYKIVNI